MSSHPNARILVIDYEPRSIESVLRPLREAGYEVEVANDGLAGIEAFERTRPDLVLVEAMLPKKHGFEVCQAIKSAPGGKGIPVLITTAVYKGRRYRNEALSVYGCDEYVEKPIPDEQLISLCGRFLSRELDDRTEESAAVEAEPAEVDPPALPVVRSESAEAAPQEPAADLDPVPLDDLTEEEIVDRLDSLLDGIQGRGEDASNDDPEPAGATDAGPSPPRAETSAEGVDPDPNEGAAPGPVEAEPPAESAGSEAASESAGSEPPAESAPAESIAGAEPEVADDSGASKFETAGEQDGSQEDRTDPETAEPETPPAETRSETPPSPDGDGDAEGEPPTPAPGKKQKIRGGELTAGNVDQVVEDLFEELSSGADAGSNPEGMEEHGAPTEDPPVGGVETREPADASEDAGEAIETSGSSGTDEAESLLDRAEGETLAPDGEARSSGMPKWLLPAVAAVLLVLGGAAAWYFLGGAPAEEPSSPSVALNLGPAPAAVSTRGVDPLAASEATPPPDPALEESIAALVESGETVPADPRDRTTTLAPAERPPAKSQEPTVPAPKVSSTAPASSPSDRSAKPPVRSEPVRSRPEPASTQPESTPSAEPEPAASAKPEPPASAKPEASAPAASDPEPATARPDPVQEPPPAVAKGSASAPERDAASTDDRGPGDGERAAAGNPPTNTEAEVSNRPSPAQAGTDRAGRGDSPVSAAVTAEPEPEPEPPAPPRATRGQLMTLAQVDQPPFPVHKPAPEYDAFARRLEQQGTVVLRLLIDENGRVADVEFVSRIPNSRLNDSAVSATEEWIYRPAYVDGIPVKVWIVEKIVFKL